jgi:D-alanine-D-alanine ligase-like ATP-grasp enzyme
MKICVLQPSYENSDLDYKEYDPPRDLSHLIPEAIFQNVFLKKSTVYKQLKDLKKENFDIFVNLCQGYLDWDIPSIDVIFSLENLNLPYTGSPLHLYDPSKDLMKYISYSSGVSTPNFTLANNISELNLAVEQLTFPFFIKPSHAGDSLGIDNNSKIYTKDELKNQAIKLFKEFDALLIEEYIEGREFSVLVIANPEDVFSPIVLHPVEFVFPEGEFFKTYKLKTTEFHPNSNILCQDNSLAKQLQESAKQIFTEFEGLGYARMDFRVDKNNKIFFLEINFACSVFYNMGYYGTADYILNERWIWTCLTF